MSLQDLSLAQLARVNTGIGPNFSDAVINPIDYSRCDIVCVGSVDLVDGEQFSIPDGDSDIVFEFYTGSTIPTTTVPVEFLGGQTPEQIHDKIISVINGSDNNLGAVSLGTPNVRVTNSLYGSDGHGPCTDTVTNATFSVSDMAGGVDFPTERPVSGVDVSNATKAVLIVETSDGEITFSAWSRSYSRTTFEPLFGLTNVIVNEDFPFKQILNCAPDSELTITIDSVTGFGESLKGVTASIGPCEG